MSLVRVLRVIEYVGEADVVEGFVKRAINGTSYSGDCQITAATIEAPTAEIEDVLDEARKVKSGPWFGEKFIEFKAPGAESTNEALKETP